MVPRKSWSTNGEQHDVVVLVARGVQNRIAYKRRTIEAHVNELISDSACHITGDNSTAELLWGGSWYWLDRSNSRC